MSSIMDTSMQLKRIFSMEMLRWKKVNQVETANISKGGATIHSIVVGCRLSSRIAQNSRVRQAAISVLLTT